MKDAKERANKIATALGIHLLTEIEYIETALKIAYVEGQMSILDLPPVKNKEVKK